MESDEFYKMMSQPGMPDGMAFEIGVETPKPDRTFSREGIQDVISHVQDFVVARTMGKWKETGAAPHKVRILVTLDWDAKGDIKEGEYPFFEGDLLGSDGLLLVDMENRVPRDRS